MILIVLNFHDAALSLSTIPSFAGPYPILGECKPNDEPEYKISTSFYFLAALTSLDWHFSCFPTEAFLKEESWAPGWLCR